MPTIVKEQEKMVPLAGDMPLFIVQTVMNGPGMAEITGIAQQIKITTTMSKITKSQKQSETRMRLPTVKL